MQMTTEHADLKNIEQHTKSQSSKKIISTPDMNDRNLSPAMTAALAAVRNMRGGK